MGKLIYSFLGIFCLVHPFLHTQHHMAPEMAKKIDSLDRLLKQVEDVERQFNLKTELAICYMDVNLKKAKKIAMANLKDSDKIKNVRLIIRLERKVSIIFAKLGEYQLALLHGEKSYRLSKENNVLASQFWGLTNLGGIHYEMGNLKEAILNTHKALTLLDVHAGELDTNAKTLALNNLAVYYDEEGNNEKALGLYQKVYDIALESKDDYELGRTMVNMSCVFGKIGNHEKAINLLLQSEVHFKKLKSEYYLGFSYANLSSNYIEINKLDSALYFGKRALKMSEQVQSSVGISSDLLNLGMIQHALKDYDQALHYLNRALLLEKDIKNVENYPRLLGEFSQVYLAMGQYQKALDTAEEYYQFSLKTNLLPHLEKSGRMLAGIHEKLGNPEQALFYYKAFMKIKDSLFSKEKYLEIGRIEASHEADQREREQKAQITLQQSEIKRQEAFNKYIGMTLLLTTLLSLVLGKIIQIKKKSNTTLREKNNEITEQKNRISEQESLLRKYNTELEETIQKLSGTRKQLVQSEKMASLGILVAGVAHEMNNPINFASCGVNALKKRLVHLKPLVLDKNPSNKNTTKLIDEIDELMKTVENGTQRSAKIVKDLSLFAYKDNDHMGPVSLNDILDSTLNLLKKELSNITLVKNFGSIPMIQGFGTKLTQVFTNIILNALQAISKNGILTITTLSESTNEVQVLFHNTGPKIKKEILPHIFDPFFTTKPIGKGTGLGLSISFGIVEQHNGSITCQSHETKGTTFLIKLPVNQKNLVTNER